MKTDPNIFPLKIERVLEDSVSGPGLKIFWQDNKETFLPSKLLRDSCPCASCLEASGKGVHEKPLGGKSSLLRVVKSTAEESLKLEKVWSIGNYAIGILWGDKHDTGIYPFRLLRDLSDS